MASFDDIRKKATLPTATVSLCLAGELVEELDALEQQYALLGPPTNLGDDRKQRLLDQITAKQDEMRESTVDFRLRAMPARQFYLFWATMPVREENESDKAWGERSWPFYAEMVARTVAEPAMTMEEVGELCDLIAMTSWNKLANECLRLNNRAVDVPNFVAVSDPTGPSGLT